MEKINENIASNIAMLRKANGWTQGELANRLNYSDKAISKWERNESIPDVEILNNIALLFNVDVDFLIKEHSEKDIKINTENKKLFVRNLLIMIMICVAIFLVATVIFVFGVLRNKELANKLWVSFVVASSFCCLVNGIYAKKENYLLMQIISWSLMVWTIITSFYCIMLVSNYENGWLLYAIGVPVQAAICIYFFWKKTF